MKILSFFLYFIVTASFGNVNLFKIETLEESNEIKTHVPFKAKIVLSLENLTSIEAAQFLKSKEVESFLVLENINFEEENVSPNTYLTEETIAFKKRPPKQIFYQGIIVEILLQNLTVIDDQLDPPPQYHILEQNLGLVEKNVWVYILLSAGILLILLVVWSKRKKSKSSPDFELAIKRKLEKILFNPDRESLEELYRLRKKVLPLYPLHRKELQELFTRIEEIQYKKNWFESDIEKVNPLLKKLHQDLFYGIR